MKKKRKKPIDIFLYVISLRWLFALPVLFYKKCMSPLMPSVCIYYPSCSTYMLYSIKEFGIKGVFLGIGRLLRCSPRHDGGYDPVPVNRKGDIKWLF
ncbi:MAG: membrane protein insertion efficiency factor YidD [Clostridiales bacterium]|nr:membrane protein insertion efficiency factor YidD [Clostridiales bacterium]